MCGGCAMMNPIRSYTVLAFHSSVERSGVLQLLLDAWYMTCCLNVLDPYIKIVYGYQRSHISELAL
jgi:hypothetical protein